MDEEAPLPQKLPLIIEALLFASSEPLSIKKIVDICNSADTTLHRTAAEVRRAVADLKDEHRRQGRSFHIAAISDGYVLRTNEDYRRYLDTLFKKKQTSRLSRPALEVLSIVAFKQQVTRAQIEEIRGVDSSGILQTLLEKEFIHSSGKLEAPGRPTLFSVTKEFLHYFGLKQLSDLEQIKE